MQKANNNYEREKAIYRYIQALDNGDMDGVAKVLELALYDSELERIIEEIDLAYAEEDGITPIATDARIIKDLIHQHLHSAFEEPEKDRSQLITEFSPEETTQPITVGDVARHLQQSTPLTTVEYELVQSLLNSSIPIPSYLNIKAIKQLFTDDLQHNASPRFLDKFRTIAIELGMKHSHGNTQLAAARQQKSNCKQIKNK
jgi:hypothetical protein